MSETGGRDVGPLPLTFVTILIRLAIVVAIGANIYIGVRTSYRAMTLSDLEYFNSRTFIDGPFAQIIAIAVCFALYLLLAAIHIRPVRPLISSRASEDGDIRRRRDAKRFNERLKLSAAALSTAGTSALVAGFVLPAVNQTSVWSVSGIYGVAIAMLCYCLAQLLVSFWKTEE